jgi:hypothetical protein
MVQYCCTCNNEINENEIVYLCNQGKVSENCFVKQVNGINILICSVCMDTFREYMKKKF